jgi:hypothetical protein
MKDYLTKSNDLEALELAGKALALRIPMYYEAQPEDGFPMPFAKIGKREYWNPYCDDGDAMRGAVLKGLRVCIEQEPAGVAYCTDSAGHRYPAAPMEVGADRAPACFAAARKAVVLALAEVGASLQGVEATTAIDEPGRREFEAKCRELAVKHYRYANADAALLDTLFERRTNGTYAVDWVDGAWIGYQTGRESLVVELPRPFMSGYTESGNCPATDLYSFDDVKSAIEAAGGKVKA